MRSPLKRPTAAPVTTTAAVARRLLRRALLPAGLAAALTPIAVGVPGLPTRDADAGPRAVTPGQRRDEVVDVYERCKPAVVNIHSERTVTAGLEDPFRSTVTQTQRVNGMGTGIVLDPRGYILTNFHVVDDVNSLRVRLHDGAGYTARVVALDKEADLALMKVEPSTPLPCLPFGTSSDLMVGEAVIAIGNAYGYEHTVTDGRVSFKGRDVTLNKDMGYKNLIQTSAPINPGNSGGPLLNTLGELVGVNVAIRAGAQNIGFALPIDFVIGRAADMLSTKRRAGLRHGLHVKDTVDRGGDQTPAKRSVVVDLCEADSPAEAGGFKPGDVVEKVGDVAVVTSIDIERGFLDKPAGVKVPVRVRRPGAADPVTIDVALQQVSRPFQAPQPAGDVVWAKLGVRLAPVGPTVVAPANPQLHGGMLVQDVSPGSAAAAAGLQRGDVLVGLHSWETITADNVTFVLNHKDLAQFQPLKFYVARDGKLRDGWLNNLP